MANELELTYVGATNVYATIRNQLNATVWNGTTFETWTDADYANYVIPLTSEGGSLWQGDFPTSIPAGDYIITYRIQDGASPATTDPATSINFSWNGTTAAPSGSSATHYAQVSDLQSYQVNGQTVDLSGFTNDVISSRIQLAEELIETVCNDIFYQKTATYNFPFAETIMFGPVVPYKLLSVNTIQRVFFSDTNGTEVTNVLFTYPPNLYVLKPYSLTLRHRGNCCRRVSMWDFIGGAGRYCDGGAGPLQDWISVNGVWGWSSVPLQIKESTIILALERLITGSTQLDPDNVTQAVWNDFTVTYKAADKKTMVGTSTGIFYVDQLLGNFINNSMLFLNTD